jgi:hypothetical protein
MKEESAMDRGASFRSWAAGSHAQDLGSRSWALGVWALGLVMTTVGFFWAAARPGLWLVAFGTSGALCVANGIRARRFHCLFTGPFFLVGTGLVGLRWAGKLGACSWELIGLGVLGAVGGAILVEVLRKGGKLDGGCC